MPDIYMYADETGDLDMTGARGTSTYFGFGTAVFDGEHGRALWEGLQLRCRLESKGVRLPQGFHAKNDSKATRAEVFDLLFSQAPRIDTTFLYKANAYERVRAAGQVRLYKLAWYLHFKEIAIRVSRRGDRLFVVVGSMQTHNKRDAIRHALEDVCGQVGGRQIVPCIWEARSAWGIQVADDALWAVQRELEGKDCVWYLTCVEPILRSTFTPWGRAE